MTADRVTHCTSPPQQCLVAGYTVFLSHHRVTLVHVGGLTTSHEEGWQSDTCHSSPRSISVRHGNI